MTASTHATFVPHVGEVFVAEAPGGAPMELRLVSADLHTDTEQQHGFALVFRGPHDPALGQGLYALQHEALGALSLFLVPVGMEADGRLYEAVFNLLKPVD